MKVEMKKAVTKKLDDVPSGKAVRIVKRGPVDFHRGDAYLILNEHSICGTHRLVANIDTGCVERWLPSDRVTVLNVVAVEQ